MKVTLGDIVCISLNSSWRVIGPLVTVIHSDLSGVALSRDYGKILLAASDGLWENRMPNEVGQSASWLYNTSEIKVNTPAYHPPGGDGPRLVVASAAN